MGLVATVNRGLIRQLERVGIVSSPELLAAARVLKRKIRKTLGAEGDAFQGPLRPGKTVHRRAPSRPGEPPAKQTGGLQKSVISGAVGTAQRVAVTKFTAPLLEFGVDTEVDARRGTVRSRRDLFTGAAREVLKESAKRQQRRQRARTRSQKAHRLTIEPRPFMQRSLAAARDEMVDVTVSEIRRRLPSA